jgi:hypothetical protein
MANDLILRPQSLVCADSVGAEKPLEKEWNCILIDFDERGVSLVAATTSTRGLSGAFRLKMELEYTDDYDFKRACKILQRVLDRDKKKPTRKRTGT